MLFCWLQKTQSHWTTSNNIFKNWKRPPIYSLFIKWVNRCVRFHWITDPHIDIFKREKEGESEKKDRHTTNDIKTDSKDNKRISQFTVKIQRKHRKCVWNSLNQILFVVWRKQRKENRNQVWKIVVNEKAYRTVFSCSRICSVLFCWLMNFHGIHSFHETSTNFG